MPLLRGTLVCGLLVWLLQIGLPATGSHIDYVVEMAVFISTEKENSMKKLKLFTVTLVLAGMTGCISFGSSKAGPQGPQGEPGAKETIIIVPENQK